MTQQHAEETATLQDLILTLERHLSSGFDGQGKPLSIDRRMVMNSLLSEFRERIAALNGETPSADHQGENPPQTTDGNDAAPLNAEEFNERARKFLEQRQRMMGSRDTMRPQR
jgi:hypothetical protein